MASKFSREDIFILLASMGISLPATTKISDEDLTKRLGYALDAAQRLRTTIDTSTPFTPTDHPLWPADRDLVGATNRMGFKEMITSRFARGPKEMEVSSDKRDTFQEMRNVVMGIAKGLSATSDFCMTEHTGDLTSCGVYLHVSGVYCIKDTPVYVLLYKELAPDEKESSEDFLEQYIELGKPVIAIKTTEFEQLALLKLFRLNSKRLSPDFHPAKDKDHENFGLKTTFLLPLGTISMQDMGRLTENIGCEVCGKTKISRCVQCLSVSYCGTECQKKDWPNHKPSCRSLKGGTWKTLTFEAPNRVLINNRETVQDALARRTSSGPRSTTTTTPTPSDAAPPDIHNGRLFLVKFQISLFQFKDEANMVIYDRQRSFNALWRRRAERDLFDEAEESMGNELRMYRWARRVGDFQLSVCFDRPPSKNPPW